MIGFGAAVVSGLPQDEKVISLTGLTGPAGISLLTSGYVGVIIGPILVVGSGKTWNLFNVSLRFHSENNE